MTTTLQQMIAEPQPLLDRARTGEEIVLTDGGKPVLKVTGVAPQTKKVSAEALKKWMEEAAALAAASATGKRGMTADEIVNELREERTSPTDAEMESRRKWLDQVSQRAAEASMGKNSASTTGKIIGDLRSERC